jgi:hypothetical protein
LDGGRRAAVILGAAAVWLVLRTIRQCGTAGAVIEQIVREAT